MARDLPMDTVGLVQAYAPLAFRAVARVFRTDCHAALRDIDYLRAMRVRPTLTTLRYYFLPRNPDPGRGCGACAAVRHPVRFRCFVCHDVRRNSVATPCWAATVPGVRCRRSTVGNTRLCTVHVKRLPLPVLAAARWLPRGPVGPGRAPGAE